MENPTIKSFDYVLFHSPYCKLVQKSYARLFYNDFKRKPELESFESVRQFQSIDDEESLRSKELEKAFVGISKSFYQSRVLPTLLLATQVGNMYCASLYGTLVSLLSSEDGKDLVK